MALRETDHACATDDAAEDDHSAFDDGPRGGARRRVGALQGISTPREAAPEAKSSAAEAIIASFAPTGAGPGGGVRSTIFSVEKIYSPPVFSSGRHQR
jgi:hypothetical protein